MNFYWIEKELTLFRASDGVNYDWRIEFYQKYGPIYQIFGPLGSRISVTVADPALIDQLLNKQNMPKAEMVRTRLLGMTFF